jgi:hypothetical protein
VQPVSVTITSGNVDVVMPDDRGQDFWVAWIASTMAAQGIAGTVTGFPRVRVLP